MATTAATVAVQNASASSPMADMHDWSVGSVKYRDHVNSITIRPADFAVRRLLGALPANPASSRILDVGCGSGMVTLALSKHTAGVPIIATDYAQGMVDITAALCLPDVTTQLADACDLQGSGLQPDSFTHATCNFCLQFVDDAELGVAELSRVLQPGGAVALGTWGDAPHVNLWASICKELDPFYELDEAVWRKTWRSKEDVARTMEASGFHVISNEITSATLIHTGAERMADYFFTGENPALERFVAGFKGDVKVAEARFRERFYAADLNDFDIEVFVTVGIKEAA